MTKSNEKHEHQWGEWERVADINQRANPPRVDTGDRARECKVCGRWDIEWATT